MEPAKTRFCCIRILYFKSVGFGCGFVTQSQQVHQVSSVHHAALCMEHSCCAGLQGLCVVFSAAGGSLCSGPRQELRVSEDVGKNGPAERVQLAEQ